MSEIEPPKPKSSTGRKRGNLSVAEKAKISARQSLKEQKKKIDKTKSELVNARKKRDAIIKTSNALEGKKSSVLETTDVEQLTPTVQEHVEDNVIFKPNE